MKTFRNGDGSLYTPTEWFVARLTFVCERTEEPCANWPCSWQVYYWCDDMSALSYDPLDPEVDAENLVYGDCQSVPPFNVAYPISETRPSVGDIVLMRYRGSVVNGDTGDTDNVFEFLASGGGTSYSDSCCRVLNVDCSGGFLAVLYSDSCVQTTTSTTPAPGDYISTDGSGSAMLINGTGDRLLFG